MRGDETAYGVRLFRLLRFAWHVAAGVFKVGLVFPFASRQRQLAMIRRWAAGILDIFNVSLSIKGEAPDAAASRLFFAANHISWLDPALLMAVRPAHFVAKSEIRSWPLLGWLAERAGTFFIQRHKRHDTARVNQKIIAALNGGESIGVFPEGATTDGNSIRPFHASLLEPAIAAQAVVCPVAIRYCDAAGAINTAVAYVDNMSFRASVKQVLAQPAIHAELVFAAPIPAAGGSRRELAHLAEQAIASALSLAAPSRQPGTPRDLPAAPRKAAPPTGSPYPAS